MAKAKQKNIIKRKVVEEELRVSNGKNYFFVIGIDAYEFCPKLSNAVKDALEIKTILLEKYQFEESNVKMLINKEATLKNIYETLLEFAKEVTDKDNFILYYSGHGEYNETLNSGFWIPVNAKPEETHLHIPNDTIKTYLNAIKSHHTFIMVDSCFSGTLFLDGVQRNIPLHKEKNASRWGLTAGRKEFVTDGKIGTNSPFARSIIKQLSTATTPLPVTELCNEVIEVVSANSDQTPRGEPLKMEGHDGGQFVFHQKDNELEKWEIAKKINSIDSFDQFLKDFPTGQFAQKAQAIIDEMKLWQVVFFKGAAENLRDYIAKYPEGIYIDQANEILNQIKSWQNTLKINTIEGYTLYLEKAPIEKYKETAKKHIKDLTLWAQAVEDYSLAAIVDYAEQFPNGLKIEQADDIIEEIRLWENALNKNECTLFETYLKKYPNGKFNNLAEENLKNLSHLKIFEEALNLPEEDVFELDIKINKLRLLINQNNTKNIEDILLEFNMLENKRDYYKFKEAIEEIKKCHRIIHNEKYKGPVTRIFSELITEWNIPCSFEHVVTPKGEMKKKSAKK